MDMRVLIYLLYDIKYQIVCDSYLRVLCATILFFGIENHSLSVW